VIDFCREKGVGTIFVGDPRGVRDKDGDRHHNRRINRWEVGKDLSYLGYKAPLAGMTCFTGDERGTSSRCPFCRHRHKPKGRLWRCPACEFTGHRDVVGAVNMHTRIFDQQVTFPVLVTYRPAGPERAARGINNRHRASEALARRSSPDTGLPERVVVSVLPGAGSATGLPVGPQGPRIPCAAETQKPTPFRE
jgi:putative transposase